MNLKTLVIIFLILAIGGFAFVSLTQNKAQETSPSSMMPAPGYEDTPEMVVSESSNGGYLTEYSDASLEQAKGKRLVLFFYANWCPTCRPVDQELSESSEKLPEDVVVIRVNYNDDQVDATEEKLAKRYGITYQHTFVLINEIGDEVKKWNGGDLDRIISELN